MFQFLRKAPRAVVLDAPAQPHPDTQRADALQRQVTALAQELALMKQREAAEARTPPGRFTAGDRFVVAIPFCDRDLAGVLNLLEWVRELGEENHGCLLCAPAGMDAGHVHVVKEAALKAFTGVELIRTSFDLPREGWPTGTCWSFLHIAHWARENRVDFWLNEPDCIPLRRGWSTALFTEYQECGKPYMGFIEEAHPAGHYPQHMTGNGAYNWQVFQHVRADKLGVAWDVAMADALTPQCHHTNLFHQDFGPLDHPPTFASVDDLARIPREAVVFHRNKDGTLIRRLRETLG